jgi:hypothetical protein
MAKTQGDTNVVAESNETEPTTTKVIAEWVGSESSPRLQGRLQSGTARELTRKQVKDGLVMDITKDLRWDHTTNFRVDVTDQPQPFIEWLDKQSEFKVTEE